MANGTKIQWTEATWNPVRGCTKVSPGCAHCYAETFAERFRGVKGHPYEQGFDLRLVPEKLKDPINRKAPTTYFVNSMSDLFQDGVPETFILDAFLTMEKCPQHTFQILTKRAERMRDVVKWLGRKWADEGDQFPLPNVWLGVSVESQRFADERIPLLLQTPAAVRFISAEPLLSAINLRDVNYGSMNGSIIDTLAPWDGSDPDPGDDFGGAYLDWVIVGGESGAGARPFDIVWARDIVRQCKAAGVPVFVKQLGASPYTTDTPEGIPQYLSFGDRKGGDPSEWPEDLRVREFPR